MFKIKPLENKDEQKEICEVCGAVYHEDSFAFASVDMADINSKEEVIGICEFVLNPTPRILEIRCVSGRERDESMLILLHTVCAFLERCNYKSVVAPESSNEQYMHTCGFIKKNGEYVADLTCRGCASKKEGRNE